MTCTKCGKEKERSIISFGKKSGYYACECEDMGKSVIRRLAVQNNPNEKIREAFEEWFDKECLVTEHKEEFIKCYKAGLKTNEEDHLEFKKANWENQHKLTSANKQIEDMTKEHLILGEESNKVLAQLEDMKCCGNCYYEYREDDICNTCCSFDKWKRNKE